MTASAGQPYQSTKILHGPPSPKSDVLVDTQNSWDPLAEVAIASCSEPSAQLDCLSLLLQSHGVVVHRVPAPQSHSPTHSARSSSSLDPHVSPTRIKGVTNGKEPPGANVRHRSLFLHNAALVYGTRVIEVPPPYLRPSRELQATSGAVDHTNSLFNLLENTSAEVIRWHATSPSRRTLSLEGKLVDIDETSDGADTEEDGPRFSPSDILVLSPTLLITRLSPCTNNKGLEYIWSVLSRPTKVNSAQNNEHPPPADGQEPAVNIPIPPRPTTTLLVRITEHDSSAANSPAIPNAATYSPRNSVVSLVQPTPPPYTPLCRALVPIDGRIMLYDPALVAAGEARRLKSVLDRVQEGSRGAWGSIGDSHEFFAARSSKRDSAMSYGTFGSLDHSDDEGWQFISVDGLHSTSILLVSPRLALVSLAPTGPAAPVHPLNHDALLNVSQVLESLGIRTVSAPFSELHEKGGGVRDAVMVLRRESDIDFSDDTRVECEQKNVWDQQQGEEEPTPGCFEALTASITTFFCGLFSSSASSSASEADMSV